MNFLNPGMISLAAGLTIPPLIALYFLKLKRAVHIVPSTLLWRRAVEDLQVNAPFQRLRKSLLLLLQLLVLLLAALALGKPMFQTAETRDDTVLLLVDQSASMAVMESNGKTRLEMAKEQAKRTLDGLPDDARVMVIAFCDRGTIASSFDTDKEALRRKIDSIEQTDSSTTLTEAISLAEAYAQNLIIGSDEPGADIAPDSSAQPATVYFFTDGKVEDADKVTIEKFDASKIRVIPVGDRQDNVGIVAMDASRNYERPDYLEVTAAIENFGPEPVTVDAVLYIDGQNVDVQTVSLAPAPSKSETKEDQPTTSPSFGHVQVAAFDQVVFEGSGVVEVVLQVDDALSADDRAWTVIDPPRRARVLLVTSGNLFLEGVLRTLAVEPVFMTPSQYESADNSELIEEDRSAFDVVILDRHSTKRLPQGNYLFWASVPMIDGVSSGDVINNEIIFDWDETHPILRHVAVETLDPLTWIKLNLPLDATEIIEGQKSTVMAYLTRKASQYLICAFSVIAEDEQGRLYRNGNWVASLDFVVLVQNMVQFLASNISVRGERGVSPGEPVTLPVPSDATTVEISRPDGRIDEVPAANFQTIHYAQTRKVGTYRVDPSMRGHDVFAVNLYNEKESDVSPSKSLTLGAGTVEAKASAVEVNEPAWQYFLLGLLAILMLEWIIYNQRVFV